MTRPGDPGYAAAARASATAATETPDASQGASSPGSPGSPGSTGSGSPGSGSPGSGSTGSVVGGIAAAGAALRRTPWTLRRRLILLVAGLLVAMSAVVGVATVVLFHASSVERLDASLRAAASRADIATGPGIPSDPRATVRGFLGVPGQPDGTLGGIFIADQSDAAYIAGGQLVSADADARLALADVPADRRVHTITAGTLGEYRSLAFETVPGVRVALALPLTDVAAQTRQLALTVAGVAAGGILIALGAGSILARRALEPLERVTATAQAVSELPLDRGDVDLDERVPVDDPRTEVGQLGTAFNRMLGHVASALSAREQSERKVRRFVADASHELRTPLASIRGYAELTRLHGGALPDDVVHAISRIESESVRMTELVEDLLLLARLDEGREIVHAPVDLAALAADAVADAQAAGPDHDWSVELPGGPVVVSGDEPRLRQVLANLLANARVHTPAGTRVVVALSGASRETASTADGVARLTVADDGPGIDPSVQGRLFERFARGDASRSRRAGSTGLGLAIVRAVVEAHDGTVEVESEPGSTLFTVTLPLADTSRSPLPAVE